MKIDKDIAEAFEHAAENGYTFEGWSTRDIAIDMCTYDSTLEKYEVEDVMEAIEIYKKSLS